MEGFWPIFFLAVILKIPVAGLLYLVWWAIHQTPEEAEDAPPASEDRDPLHWRRGPKKPSRGPRRGPHAPDAQPVPHCPPGGRIRVFTPPVPVRAATAHARGSAEPERESAT